MLGKIVCTPTYILLAASWFFCLNLAQDFDVCIIGAGSAGLYSAIKLKDFGYNVALIEKAPTPGGHAFYFEGDNVAVQINPDTPFVHDFYKRLGMKAQP